MRYQERIYIENNNSALRNRSYVNVNMSSDMCIFNSPKFNLSGATKIDCTGNTSASTYMVSSETTIPVTFIFTSNTESFSATNASFKYEIYKYNENFSGFSNTPSYKSVTIDYSSFSGTNTITETIPISDLNIDGEYLVKGYYNFNVCSDFLGRLGKNIDTSLYKGGTAYGIYDNNLDYYFKVIKQPDKPIFLINGSNDLAPNLLQQQIILGNTISELYDDEGNLLPPQPFNSFVINGYSGDFIVTLNGLTLSPLEDYTFSGNLVTLNEDIVSDDIVSVISTTNGSGSSLKSDNIFVDNAIPSGTTNNEGSNSYYFNSSTNKYEIYTTITPLDGNNIIVMLNGATLANGVDFYQSTTNKKRIILVGDLLVGDVILIAYIPQISVVNGINTTNPYVSWSVETPPQKENGLFTLEISSGNTFSTIMYTSTTPYIVGVTMYGLPLSVSGTVGTNLYYRVKNEKNYTTLCNTIINGMTYSDVIPITIQSNSINSY